MIGETLGHYRVLEKLGGGGMGVVYKAEDTTLERYVALKFLPEEAVADSRLRERFLREARAAAALNHPNICTIHEVGEHEGRPFIAMELLQGKTLEQRIDAKPIKNQQLLEWALQIADALELAHTEGVIHRDIKPSNIFITDRDQARILDFGLAKLAPRKRRAGPLASSEPPTATGDELRLTQPGMTVGTVAYMSPEQVRGEELDARSDLFSFGVVLYEMATGREAFTGNTSGVIFDAILNRAPTAPVRLNPDIPPHLEEIINKALEKDRDLRYQSAAELRADLKRVKRDSDSHPTDFHRAQAGSAATTAGLPSLLERRAQPLLRRHRWWILASGTVLAVAVLLVVASLRRPGSPAIRLGGGRLTLLFSSQGQAFDPALSPDGTMIAYVAEEDSRLDLVVSRAAGGGHVRLTEDEAREEGPKFSPDGEQIAFTRSRPDAALPEICLVPSLGGEVVPIVAGALDATWSPDGARLAFVLVRPGEPSTLATAAADGTDLRPLLTGDGIYPFLRNPAWSPDGKQIAVQRSAGGVASEIWLVPAAGGPPRRVSNDPAEVFSHGPVFTPDGRGIVHSSNRAGATNLWVMPVDGSPPVQLTSGPGPDESPSVARGGSVAFVNPRSRLALVVHNLTTRATRELLTHSSFIWAPAFSPDGREIAFSRAEVDGSWHIWMVPVAGGRARRLTSGAQGEIYPRFSPDGASVLYSTWSHPRRIGRVPRGGGPVSFLTNAGEDAGYGDLSPDGRWLAFARTKEGATRIYVAPTEGSEAGLLTDSPSTLPRWSPNGKWIAFSPDRGYSGGIFIIGADGAGLRRLTERGGWPVWWPDGKRLGYLVIGPDGTQQVRTVPFAGGPSRPVPGLRFPGTNYPIDISPDGTLLATSNDVHLSADIWLMEPPP